MSTFIKSDIFDYKNDEFYNEVIEIFSYKYPELKGSYSKYGKEKSCDMDINEFIPPEEGFNKNSFDKFIDKLIENKNKYYLLEAKFGTPYEKLKRIRDKISLDGIFHKHIVSSILPDIDELPDELRKPLKELATEFISNQTLMNFIKIQLFVKEHIYPNWKLSEIKKGEKKYYDTIFRISDMEIKNFVIEVIYKGFRISNVINFYKQRMEEDMIYWSVSAVVENNILIYTKMLKHFMSLLKWLYFKNKVTDSELHKRIPSVYNELYGFIENMNSDNSRICKYKNKIDILKMKIKKYEKKIRKNKNKEKYDKYIKSYKRAIDKLQNEYDKGRKEINELAKDKYERTTAPYKEYLQKYVRYD